MTPFSVTILGSGSSTGVPSIGCDCSVCQSSEPKNKRTRASILIHFHDSKKNWVIDTGADFRYQMLCNRVQNLDNIFITHTHADHCHGFDDVRAFYFRSKEPLDLWIHKEHIEEFRTRFAYVFSASSYAGSRPVIELHELDKGVHKVDDIEFESAIAPHGPTTTTVFRIGSFVYATDFKSFPRHLVEAWKSKVTTMIASGISFDPHPTHSSVYETLDLFDSLGIKHGIVTHLSHRIDYGRDAKHLQRFAPSGAQPVYEFAYDGMKIEIS